VRRTVEALPTLSRQLHETLVGEFRRLQRWVVRFLSQEPSRVTTHLLIDRGGKIVERLGISWPGCSRGERGIIH